MENPVPQRVKKAISKLSLQLDVLGQAPYVSLPRALRKETVTIMCAE